MNFGEIFDAGGVGKYFLSSTGSKFVATGHAKKMKIGQNNNVFIAKMNFEDGEIIHDRKFSFYAIALT